MILKMPKNCTDEQLNELISILTEQQIEHYLAVWRGQKIIICKNDVFDLPSYVESQIIDTPYKLATKEFQHEKTSVDIDGIKLEGNNIIIIAGSCAVENRDSNINEELILEI